MQISGSALIVAVVIGVIAPAGATQASLLQQTPTQQKRPAAPTQGAPQTPPVDDPAGADPAAVDQAVPDPAGADPAVPGQTTPGQTAPGQVAPAPAVVVPPTPGLVPPVAPLGRVFASESGMIFSPIRPDRVLDFETALKRIHEALAASTDPVRRRQAAGWKVFKAVEPGPNATVLYAFVMDPAVIGADYTVSRILSEVFPTEVQAIYKLYNGAFAGGQTLLNLRLLANFGEPLKVGMPSTTKKPAAPVTPPISRTPAAPTGSALATPAPRTTPSGTTPSLTEPTTDTLAPDAPTTESPTTDPATMSKPKAPIKK